LRQLTEEIQDYREKTGHPPASLTDPTFVKDRRFIINDAWDRPFHYEVEGDAYDLYSLGEDDQPGGYGPDADLHAGKFNRDTECLTLRQFTSHPMTGGIKLTCILAGVLAFPLCLLGVNKRLKKGLPLRSDFRVHGITTLFAILAAIVISVLHLPSGH
jgi:hypothetical protein